MSAPSLSKQQRWGGWTTELLPSLLLCRQLQLQGGPLLCGEQASREEPHQRLPAVQPQSSESYLPERPARRVLKLRPLPDVGPRLSHGGSQLPNSRYSSAHLSHSGGQRRQFWGIYIYFLMTRKHSSEAKYKNTLKYLYIWQNILIKLE